jgi:hypothetical protein
MRLLKRSADGKISLEKFRDDTVPRYAILSHTWIEGKEITFQDFESGTRQDSAGYERYASASIKLRLMISTIPGSTRAASTRRHPMS